MRKMGLAKMGHCPKLSRLSLVFLPFPNKFTEFSAFLPPPPPCPRTTLRKNRPPGSTVEFSHHFF